MTEQWKPVDGFDGYAVSNTGKVQRTQAGQGTSAGVLKSTANADGYHTVSLRTKDGKTVNKYVHELVASHFIKGYNPKTHSVNHRNRKRDRNNADNLEIIDAADNKGHGRLTTKTVGLIKRMAKDGKSPAQIAAMLNLREGVVKTVLTNGA